MEFVCLINLQEIDGIEHLIIVILFGEEYCFFQVTARRFAVVVFEKILGHGKHTLGIVFRVGDFPKGNELLNLR